jgi:6-pyruvoyltetrahydropterin/6-carboxytetrahydropterin synthase
MLPLYQDKKNLIYFDDNFYTANLNLVKDEPNHIREHIESFVVVDFVPTSENLAAWLMDIVQKKMSLLGITVSKVELYETPKSKSVVSI